MHLQAYLELIFDSLHSRRDLSIEQLTFEEFDVGRTALIEGRIRFWDDSLLRFSEEVAERGIIVTKASYVYHYQSSNTMLIFRYDSAPHHPQIATHPHHKHIVVAGRESIESTYPPSLTEVLREIEHHLYPENR